MNGTSLERLEHVHPLLKDRIIKLASALEVWNHTIEVTQALRSYATQDALYAKGRTAPGEIVTKAPGGYSWHNYGLAVDVVPYLDHAPDWKLTNPAWQRIADLAPPNGLFSGSQFAHMVDWPHLQLAEIPHSPTAEHRTLFKQAGMTAVWEALGIPA